MPIKGRNGPSGEYFGQNMYASGRTKAKRMASKIEPMEAYKAKAALFPGQAIAYMQKACDVAVKAILGKKKLRKKCVNRDKSA